MFAEQLLHLMFKLTPRAKLETKGVLSTTTDSVRETTSPDVRLTLTTRRENQTTNPTQVNVLRNRMTFHPVKKVFDRRTKGILDSLSNVKPAITRPLERNVNIGRMKPNKVRPQLLKPITTSQLKRRTVKTILRQTKTDRRIATVQAVIHDIEQIAVQVRNRTAERVSSRPVMVSNHVEKLVATTSGVKTLKRSYQHTTQNLLRQSISSQPKIIGESPDYTHERDAKTRRLIETPDVLSGLHPSGFMLDKFVSRTTRPTTIKADGDNATVFTMSSSEIFTTMNIIRKHSRRNNGLQKKTILNSQTDPMILS